MHHAYLLIGSREAGELFIDESLKSLGIERQGNPDVFVVAKESFAIEHARKLIEKSLEKAFGGKRVFVISAERFTREAQNALLKTLEEPIPDSHFFVIAREEKLFLPTLLSRVVVVHTEAKEDLEPAEKLLNLNIPKRLDFVKKFESSLPDFLDSLLSKLKSSGAELGALQKVFILREYASDPAVNARMIIEHLALVL